MTPQLFRDLLDDLGLNQAGAAKALGCSRRSINGYATGERAIPEGTALLLGLLATSPRTWLGSPPWRLSPAPSLAVALKL
jgi:plasmid maintenance system antidote protein VapI